MARQKKEVFMENDEINLIDLIKVIYKWRYYALIVVVICTLIGWYIGLKKNNQPSMYSAKVIIQPALFNNKSVVDTADIIKSGSMFTKILQEVDKDTLNKELILSKKDVQKSGTILLNQWQDICKNRIVASDNTITFSMYTKSGIYKISDVVIKQVLFIQKKLLDAKFNDYLSNMKKIFKQLSFSTKKNIYIQSLSMPIVNSPKVIISARKNIVTVAKPSIIKYILISFFIGIFVSLILPFILEFFSNLDLSQINKK